MNENKNEFTLRCSCGCGDGFVFTADGDLYIETITTLFNAGQETVFSRMKRLARLLFTDRKWLTEVIVKEEDLEKLRAFLTSCELDGSSTPGENSSHIKLEYDRDCESCIMTLMCDMDKKLLLLGKEFRCHEIVMNKVQAGKFVKKISRVLAKSRIQGEKRP